MPEPEVIYLLTGEELLLLLSLVDQRPVVAFALPDSAQIPTERWTQVAVDLYRKGLVNYTDAGMLPAAPVSELLVAMKDAGIVCLALSRNADCKMQALYWSEEQSVLLQGNHWPGYRLQVWESMPDSWLGTCLGLPERIPDHAPDLSESQLAADLVGRSCPTLTDPPASWGCWEQARVIVDIYRRGQLERRWVWWQGTAVCTVLCQTESGTHLLPDCQSTRNMLNLYLRKGDPYDPS